MATIGRAAAVADIRGLRLSGFTAWLLWLFVHLMYLVGFRSRLFVFPQWAWSYATFGRSVRLIVGKDEQRRREPPSNPNCGIPSRRECETDCRRRPPGRAARL